MKHRITLTISAALGFLIGCTPPVRQGDNSTLILEEASVKAAKYRAAELEEFSTSGVSPTALIDEVLDVVVSSLSNRENVEFRDVHLKKFDGGRVLCGEVNEKNSSGTYVGFRKFYASNKSAAFEISSDRSPGRALASNAGLYAACAAAFDEGDIPPTGACDAQTIERLRRSKFTASEVISVCGRSPGGIHDQEIHVNNTSQTQKSSGTSGEKAIAPNAYGPGIHMNQYGQAITLRPQGGGVPGEHLKIKPNAYGPGIHMDQYGRPVREKRWP